MGSRSHPHRVLSVCVCVCVSRCLWVCVIEANSLQLRVITIGLYQFLSRSPSCQILAVCGRRLRGVSGSWFPRFLSPAAFLDSDRRRLVCPLLPCATRLSPYGKIRFCLRKAPLLPTESSASAYGKLRLCPTEAPPPPYGKLRLVSHCVLLLVINSLFPQLNPPVFIVTIRGWLASGYEIKLLLLVHSVGEYRISRYCMGEGIAFRDIWDAQPDLPIPAQADSELNIL